MRNIAAEAGISSRTPYNLFTSKAAVLVELLEESIAHAFLMVNTVKTDFAVRNLLDCIVQVGENISSNHDFLQSIYRDVMSSDDLETRKAAIVQARGVVYPIIKRAIDNDELVASLCPATFTEHLVVDFLGNLGMWAGLNISLSVAISNSLYGCCVSMLPFSTEKSARILSETHENLFMSLKQNCNQ